MKLLFSWTLVCAGMLFPVNPSVSQTTERVSLTFNDEFQLPDAEWIAGIEEMPESDSLFYLDHPAPLLRKGFNVPEEFVKAEMRITAAGYYETWLNGSRIGDRQLDPAWTNYSKRVYYATMDVTNQLKKGYNLWGIMLGNGFYNPLPLRMWGGRNIRNDLPVGKPCAIASLIITLKSGNTLLINTSDQWTTKSGPVRRNNVYLGEWYDARLETEGWTVSDEDRTDWARVSVVDGPGGSLMPSFFPPIRINRWLEPVLISGSKPFRQIVDFGQNFTGLIRIEINAEKGDTIRFRYGELVYPDGSLNPMTTVCGQIKRAGVGGPGAPAVAEQMDVYVAKGGGKEIFQTKFTFHGFRYVEITGLHEMLTLKEIKAGVLHSAVSPVGTISSSSEYLNQLNHNCQWTFLSNLQSVQSDCPAREKFGYGGDINATAEAYIFNYNMQDMYRKVIYDWFDAMKPDGFVDTAPFVGIEYCGISWESAFLFLQEALWLHYGDSTLVKELYQVDQEWMRKVALKHPGLVVDDGLSDHESLSKVPVELTGTCHYFQLARIMAKFARINGDRDGQSMYEDLAERLRSKIVDLFWDTPEIEVPNKQTLLATLIATGVLEGNDLSVALDRLLLVLKDSDYHITTGIFGTKYLLEALASNQQNEIAFKVVNQPGFPGWKYMIDHGATTIWETWKESDNTFSQNHPMFGSVSEWYHKWLGGIQPDLDNPGFSSVVLKPRPVRDLDSLTVEKFYNGGSLVSQWRWTGEKLTLEFTVPEGVSAKWFPELENRNLRVHRAPAGWEINRNGDSGTEIILGLAGKYVFEIY